MRKLPAFWLALLVLFGCASASAQTVSCPAGGFAVTVPDRFAEIPLTAYDDPDLALHLSDGVVNLAVYVSFAGSDNSFQVLTGNEIEYGPVNINGMDMFYARGVDEQGSWITYSWMRLTDSVTVYFVWFGNDNATLALIGEIMNSIVFDY